MKYLMTSLVIACLPALASAETTKYSPDKVKALFDQAAKDMVPSLKTTQCRTITAGTKASGKTIYECQMTIGNSLLSIDAMNNVATGIWLMVDSSNFSSGTDIWRSAGLLVRVARGGFPAGDHLMVGQSTLDGWIKTKNQYCVDDSESSAKLCLSSEDGRVYNMTVDYPK